MINLLNDDAKKQYRAARMNLKLRGYFTFLLITLVIVTGIFAGGLYLTSSERGIAEAQSAENAEQVSQYAGVRSQADAFASNLTIAKSILSQEVLYSDMVTRIASTLPPTAVLSSLTLDQKTLQQPITLNARVRTQEDAVSLKTTLENSPLFEDVNINTTSEQNIAGETNPTIRAFPVVVTISMTFTKGTPESLLP